MTLTDAGPLVALVDLDEPDHERCAAALDALAMPLVTTWPALTEAMYLLGRIAGWPGQAGLWNMIERGHLALTGPGERDLELAAPMMEKYHPMDLADASLVLAAQDGGHRVIFTLDSHFRSYRLKGGRHLDVVPG